MVTEGQTAPDFIAPAVVDGEAELLELFAELRDREAIVLLFFPADFVPASTAELCAVRDAGWHGRPELSVIGLSGDSLFSHAAYADRYGLPFPLVSDFHGGVADTYDLLRTDWEGHSDIPARATLVLDGDWEVRTIETVDDALDPAKPAPVERATATLRDLEIPVDSPEVTYDEFQ